MVTVIQEWGPNVVLRTIDGEQTDVLRAKRHIGTVMDDGEAFTAHTFSHSGLKTPGMKSTFASLVEAVQYILDRES